MAFSTKKGQSSTFTEREQRKRQTSKVQLLKFFRGHTKLYRVVYEDGEQCLSADETMKMAEDTENKASSYPNAGYRRVRFFKKI